MKTGYRKVAILIRLDERLVSDDVTPCLSERRKP